MFAFVDVPFAQEKLAAAIKRVATERAAREGRDVEAAIADALHAAA